MAEKNSTLTFEFKASLLENLTNIVFVTVLFGLLYLLKGYGLERILELGCVNVIIGVVYMASDDLTCKEFNSQFRELVNWQEIVGVCAVILAGISAWEFTYSTTSLGWIALGISAVSGAFAFFWFKVVYLKSILDTEGLDLYERNRISGKLEKAIYRGKKSVVLGLLGKTLRYRCSDNDYEKGSDYSLPFDEEKRTYLTLSKSKSQVDKSAAEIVYKYLLFLTSKLFSSHSVEVTYTEDELAAIKEAQEGVTL